MAESPSSEMIFDLRQVHDNFMSCLTESDDVLLHLYLDGYRELNKFFQLMGTIFGFVSSDIDSKIGILEKYVSDEDKTEPDASEDVADFEIVGQLQDVNLNGCGDDNNFRTFKTMLSYEREAGLLAKKDYVSGARTLLRLHRGLDFIREFLDAVGKLSNGDKTSSVCQEVYNRTLAHHHAWIIRKGATVAMYSLPTKDGLLKRVCRSESDIQKTLDILPKMLEATSEVYNRTQTLYEKYDLLNLP